MFPEHRDLISKLKTTDRHKHNEIDQQIVKMETHAIPGTSEEIEVLKKEKLLLKDQLYAILKSQGK
jgi:uncharacterized protein YdcH (DUF465 family)